MVQRRRPQQAGSCRAAAAQMPPTCRITFSSTSLSTCCPPCGRTAGQGGWRSAVRRKTGRGPSAHGVRVRGAQPRHGWRASGRSAQRCRRARGLASGSGAADQDLPAPTTPHRTRPIPHHHTDTTPPHRHRHRHDDSASTASHSAAHHPTPQCPPPTLRHTTPHHTTPHHTTVPTPPHPTPLQTTPRRTCSLRSVSMFLSRVSRMSWIHKLTRPVVVGRGTGTGREREREGGARE